MIYVGAAVTEWDTQWVLSVYTGTGGCGDDQEAESETCGTATLLRCLLSVVVKSLSEKCLPYKYLLHSILAESIVQDILTFPAHTKSPVKVQHIV
jgi:hypothetical protein